MRSPMFEALFAGAVALTVAGAACAQSFPTTPIRVIVPYPAGGATDFFARTVFPKVGEALGQSMLVENRPAQAPRSARARSREAPPTATRCCSGMPGRSPSTRRCTRSSPTTQSRTSRP